MSDVGLKFRRRLEEIGQQDADSLIAAERHYGSSWRKRGGVGAFMMLARKWDRISTALQPRDRMPSIANGSTPEMQVAPWDIFAAYRADRRREGIIDDIRDLRRYLMLVEEYVTRDEERVETEPVEETRRYPINATNHEFSTFNKTVIRSGSMENSLVSNLYVSSITQGENTVHPWTMLPEYRKEYGC